MTEFKFHPAKTYELLLKQANAMQLLIRALEKQKAFQNVSMAQMARELAAQGFEEINAQRNTNEKLTNEIAALEDERDALKAERDELLNEIPEGCTVADARMLREANHKLVAELEELKEDYRLLFNKRASRVEGLKNKVNEILDRQSIIGAHRLLGWTELRPRTFKAAKSIRDRTLEVLEMIANGEGEEGKDFISIGAPHERIPTTPKITPATPRFSPRILDRLATLHDLMGNELGITVTDHGDPNQASDAELRDRLSIAALNGVLAGGATKDLTPSEIAQKVEDIADAMMMARAKQ